MNPIIQTSHIFPLHKRVDEVHSEVSTEKPQKLIDKISSILYAKYQNIHAPLYRSSIKNIHITEVISLYSFLTEAIIIRENNLERPICPVVEGKKYTLARYDYKEKMIKYISQFGCILKDNPCSYSPGLLEALANYCEDKK